MRLVISILVYIINLSICVSNKPNNGNNENELANNLGRNALYNQMDHNNGRKIVVNLPLRPKQLSKSGQYMPQQKTKTLNLNSVNNTPRQTLQPVRSQVHKNNLNNIFQPLNLKLGYPKYNSTDKNYVTPLDKKVTESGEQNQNDIPIRNDLSVKNAKTKKNMSDEESDAEVKMIRNNDNVVDTIEINLKPISNKDDAVKESKQESETNNSKNKDKTEENNKAMSSNYKKTISPQSKIKNDSINKVNATILTKPEENIVRNITTDIQQPVKNKAIVDKKINSNNESEIHEKKLQNETNVENVKKSLKELLIDNLDEATSIISSKYKQETKNNTLRDNSKLGIIIVKPDIDIEETREKHKLETSNNKATSDFVNAPKDVTIQKNCYEEILERTYPETNDKNKIDVILRNNPNHKKKQLYYAMDNSFPSSENNPQVYKNIQYGNNQNYYTNLKYYPERNTYYFDIDAKNSNDYTPFTRHLSYSKNNEEINNLNTENNVYKDIIWRSWKNTKIKIKSKSGDHFDQNLPSSPVDETVDNSYPDYENLIKENEPFFMKTPIYYGPIQLNQSAIASNGYYRNQNIPFHSA